MNLRNVLIPVAILAFSSSGWAEEKAPGRPKHDPGVVAKWRKQFLEWRGQYFAVEANDEERFALQEAGRAKFAEVDDPVAVPAISALLQTDKLPQFRRALILPLMKIDNDESMACLVEWSVEDENPLLREEAAKALVGRQGLEKYLDTYLTYLRSPKLVANAAEALTWTRLAQPVSTVEKPDPKLTKALISALHTVQRQIVPYSVAYDSGLIPGVSPSGNINYGRVYGTDSGMVQVKIPVPQPKVLAALKEYSGQDHQYDQSAWKAWLDARSSQ
jgi:hypothetical protein